MSSSPKETRLDFLDGLRGLAAAYVMVGHARWFLWEGYSDGFLKHRNAYSPFAKALVYVLTGFRYGHEAVLFFFVLSGFAIHLRYSRKLSRDPKAVFDWTAYLKRRAKRIYPPLLLAMAWTYVFDSCISAWGYRRYYALPHFLGTQELIAPSHSWATAFGNLLFLNGTYVPAWGSNGVVWSLKYEGWFYVLFPVLFLVLRRSMTAAALIVAGLFALTAFPVWPAAILRDVFSLMIVWWFGVLLAEIHTGRLRIAHRYLSVLCLLAPPLIARRIPHFIEPACWGLFFTGMIAFCFFLQEKGLELKPLDRLKFLGGMSYSLYLLHFPMLLLLSGWLMDRSPSHSLPVHFGWVAAGIALSLLVAYLAHFIVEKPFLSKRQPSSL